MARLFQVKHTPAASRERMVGVWRSWISVWLCGALLFGPVVPVTAAAAGADQQAAKPVATPAPKPAKISIRGYGLFGNRELKRILKTLELGGHKPPVFGPSFIEDAAMILGARVKRDGYLSPTLQIKMWLDSGRTLEVQAEDLLENPLPRPLRITRVQFNVHKGVLYHFDRLDFDGLESITVKQARSYFMETETLLHLKAARVFTPDRLRRGMASLRDQLDRQGYQKAEIEANRVVRDDRNGNVDVHIQVRQGPKYVARSVFEEFFYGTNRVASSNRTVTVNKPYSRLWQQDFSLSLKTNQFSRGHPDTRVELQTLHENAVSNRVELELGAQVHAGDQIHIGTVSFEGEKRTRQTLIKRRVRIERGDLLDPVRVEEGRARLARLGVFSSVDLDYKTEDEYTRDVIYRLQEGKRLNVSLLFGYGSYELLRGGVDVEAYNLWGSAHHADIRAIQSFKATSGNLTYTVPELVGNDIDLFLNGSGLRREEINFTRVEYGGGIGLHKYFQATATDVSGRYNYQILSAQEYGSFPEIGTEGLTNPAVGSIIFELKHDRRDNPLYPTRGYKIFATVETATEYIGGDANYERIEISPSWHLPLGGGRSISLGISHGVDVTFGSPANNLPFNKRFFPGGQNSIRGYTEGEASPRDANNDIVGAETYTLGTVEFEQALTPKWSIVAFSDNLGMARRVEHYPWDTGLFTVGGGIRWRTLIGPIRLEYGHNLNPRPHDPSGTLQFSIGYPF